MTTKRTYNAPNGRISDASTALQAYNMDLHGQPTWFVCLTAHSAIVWPVTWALRAT